MKPDIATVWIFPSDSNPAKTYQTLQYVDGTTSCDCKGWTIKRAGKERSCKHTRLVDAGFADRHAVATKEYAKLTRNTLPQLSVQVPPPNIGRGTNTLQFERKVERAFLIDDE